MSTQNLRNRNANSSLMPFNTVSITQTRRSNARTPNPIEESKVSSQLSESHAVEQINEYGLDQKQLAAPRVKSSLALKTEKKRDTTSKKLLIMANAESIKKPNTQSN